MDKFNVKLWESGNNRVITVRHPYYRQDIVIDIDKKPTDFPDLSTFSASIYLQNNFADGRILYNSDVEKIHVLGAKTTSGMDTVLKAMNLHVEAVIELHPVYNETSNNCHTILSIIFEYLTGIEVKNQKTQTRDLSNNAPGMSGAGIFGIEVENQKNQTRDSSNNVPGMTGTGIFGIAVTGLGLIAALFFRR